MYHHAYCYVPIQETAAPINKKGFLYKTGSDRAGWKRRYCTLDKFRGFQYYKTETVSTYNPTSAIIYRVYTGREGERERQTDRQTDRQRDRQTDRRMDRRTETDREALVHVHVHMLRLNHYVIFLQSWAM